MDIEILAELKEEMQELLEELYIEEVNLILTDSEGSYSEYSE